MLRIPSKIRLLCRYKFYSLSFFPGWCSPFRIFLPFVIHVVACCYRFFDSFRPLVFFLIFCTLMFFAWANLADLLGSRPLLYTFYLLFECALPRKHRVCVVLLSSAPLSLAHGLCIIWVCFASQTPGLCSAFFIPFPFPFAHVLFLIQVCFTSNWPAFIIQGSNVFGFLAFFSTFLAFHEHHQDKPNIQESPGFRPKHGPPILFWPKIVIFGGKCLEYLPMHFCGWKFCTWGSELP